MTIGVFDSGLGGLVILRSIIKKLPQYDYVYLGDTKRVPYGNRAPDTIYEYTKQAIDFLFRHGCQLVILACNTASAEALRRIQQKYLPRRDPRRRVLGVVVPTVEAAAATSCHPIGVLATTRTVESRVYTTELKKLRPQWAVYEQAAPLLVPLTEHDGLRYAGSIVKEYIRPLRRRKIKTLLLACTHYPLARSQIRKAIGRGVKLISQDEIIPAKLADYLIRHPEIERKLSQRGRREFLVTETTKTAGDIAARWFGRHIKLQAVDIES